MLNTIIVGATGSVGSKVVDFLSKNSNTYKIMGIAGFKNIKKLDDQAAKHKVKYIWSHKNSDSDLIKLINNSSIQLVVIANSGQLSTTIYKESIKAGKIIAIASKEAIIIGGKAAIKMAKKTGAQIIPLDSEMVALSQLMKRDDRNINKIYLTCSGGPFLNKDYKYLQNVKPHDALAHPTWKMGKKISIESSLWINKGYEILEAHLLYGIPLSKVHVLIHPQSLVHSIIEYKNGTSLAQLSINDMHVSINYAFSELMNNMKKNTKGLKPLDLINKKLEFRCPKDNQVLIQGINLVLNAYKSGKIDQFIQYSDEAIIKFLNNEINYLDIYKYIKKNI